MTEIIAIIPARGGSKGIPQKNIRPLAGKPLLAHTIEQALQTAAITRVVVSTDDTAIAGVATDYGAEVIHRPAEISTDTASSESALLHVLDTLQKTENYQPDIVVFLQATSPLRQPDDLQKALDKFHAKKADSLLSVTLLSGFVWREGEDGAVQSFNYDYHERPRRQDAPKDWVENGSIYIFKPSILLETGNRLGGKIAIYPMRIWEYFQLDEPDDWVIIEALLQRQNNIHSPEFGLIKLLVLDFDGVLTDNRVLVTEDGTEAVMVHRGDGWGIARLKDAGIRVVVISTERNPVVAARCQKLNIEYHQDTDDKLSILKSIAKEGKLTSQQIAYMGNDVNDLACMQWVGLPIAVADAEAPIIKVAKWTTQRRGGYGAVREIADLILSMMQND